MSPFSSVMKILGVLFIAMLFFRQADSSYNVSFLYLYPNLTTPDESDGPSFGLLPAIDVAESRIRKIYPNFGENFVIYREAYDVDETCIDMVGPIVAQFFKQYFDNPLLFSDSYADEFFAISLNCKYWLLVQYSLNHHSDCFFGQKLSSCRLRCHFYPFHSCFFSFSRSVRPGFNERSRQFCSR